MWGAGYTKNIFRGLVCVFLPFFVSFLFIVVFFWLDHLLFFLSSTCDSSQLEFGYGSTVSSTVVPISDDLPPWGQLGIERGDVGAPSRSEGSNSHAVIFL